MWSDLAADAEAKVAAVVNNGIGPGGVRKKAATQNKDGFTKVEKPSKSRGSNSSRQDRPLPIAVTHPEMPNGRMVPICCSEPHDIDDIRNPNVAHSCVDHKGVHIKGSEDPYSNSAAHASTAQRAAGKGPTTSRFCPGGRNFRGDIEGCKNPDCQFNHVIDFNPDAIKKRKAKSKNERRNDDSAPRRIMQKPAPRSYAVNGNGERLAELTVLDHIKVVPQEELEASKTEDTSN
jgi:hypothetical protein